MSVALYRAKYKALAPAGGGRKKTVAKDPTPLTDLESLVEPTTSGDPQSPLRAALNLAPHRFHGDWNYTIHPMRGQK